MAQLSKNLPDYAIQKCYGARQKDFIYQLQIELGLHIGIASVLTIGLVYLLHPYFIGIISPLHPYNLHLTITEITTFIVLLTCMCLSIIFSLHFFIEKRINKSGIKNSIQTTSGKWDIKKVLTVVQMCIFCSLLCCSTLLLKQMNYIQTKDLGLNHNNVIGFAPTGSDEAFLSEMDRNPDIISCSNGSFLPGSDMNVDFTLPEEPDKIHNADLLVGDAGYLDTYQIKLLEGRNISKEKYLTWDRDNPNTLFEAVVNRKFVEQARLKNPLGTVFEAEDRKFQIVGVTEDFHIHPLHQSIKPIIICYNANINDETRIIRYRDNKHAEVIGFLKEYNKNHPNPFFPSFEYSQYNFSDVYNKDIAFVKMINTFTILAMFISGMGIFAFSLLWPRANGKRWLSAK